MNIQTTNARMANDARLFGPAAVILAGAMLLAGCASQSRHAAPSVAPVRESVTAARQSNEKARVTAQKAAVSIEAGRSIADELAAKAAPADRTEFVKLEGALSDAQRDNQLTEDQLTATATTLGDTLIKADTLEKQVNQQSADLDAMTRREADDRRQIATLEITNKRLSREVWIYKGGIIVAVIGALAYLLFSLGIITRFVTLALTVIMPWGYVILAAAAVALPALVFGLLWKLLP